MSSRWCGLVVRRRRCQLRSPPSHLTVVQNCEGVAGVAPPWFQVQEPLKTNRAEGMMHIKSIEAQSLHFEWCGNLERRMLAQVSSSSHSRKNQNYEVHREKALK
ncbi:hypothetical protein TNCV_4660701 [Trichonephila clavipes]|uniref:Uncharacterized protein n=1 Tax=Trichonephila clavipes TaxID=2585209 RepID=A0A8X6SGN9_TRICX|nr:hypothetical protein TNCV_4660701 [Trichonephila clavipes]